MTEFQGREAAATGAMDLDNAQLLGFVSFEPQGDQEERDTLGLALNKRGEVIRRDATDLDNAELLGFESFEPQREQEDRNTLALALNKRGETPKDSGL